MSWTAGQELRAATDELDWWQLNMAGDPRHRAFYRNGLAARQEDVDRAMNAVIAARTAEPPESREAGR